MEIKLKSTEYFTVINSKANGFPHNYFHIKDMKNAHKLAYRLN